MGYQRGPYLIFLLEFPSLCLSWAAPEIKFLWMLIRGNFYITGTCLKRLNAINPSCYSTYWLFQPSITFTQRGRKCEITFTSSHRRGKLVLPECKRKIQSPILSETLSERRCRNDETDNQSKNGNMKEGRGRRHVWFNKWHLIWKKGEAKWIWASQQDGVDWWVNVMWHNCDNLWNSAISSIILWIISSVWLVTSGL